MSHLTKAVPKPPKTEKKPYQGLKRTEFKVKPPEKVVKTHKICKICGQKRLVAKGYCCRQCKIEKKPSYWKLKADEWFSKWVRKIHADWRGYASCVTCGETKRWEELQNGHYESRGTHILRYDERNGHPQCYSCNCRKNGNMARYAVYMIKRYGHELLLEFEELSKQIIQRTAKDYKEIAEKYKKKFEELN